MSKYRIMVVDDSRVICAEMKKMLEGSDIEIIGYCRSGEEALEQYGTMKPDLVTLAEIFLCCCWILSCREWMA